MSEILKSLYHNLNEPVLIYDKKEDVVFHNTAFEKAFEKIDGTLGLDSFKKINYKFHYDLCLLKSQDVISHSILANAIESKYDFSAHCSYQKNQKEFLQYNIKSLNYKKYKIIYFYDVTKEIELNRVQKENEELKIQNKEFLNTHHKAQNQTFKLAFLNRISNSLKEVLDVNRLKESVLKELSIIFGATKIYYANEFEDKFKIENIYPEEFSAEIDEILTYDNSIYKDIYDDKISIQYILKEHNNSSQTLKTKINRIIIPIIKGVQTFGIIVVFTPKKEIFEIEKELLSGVSSQMASALYQASLFNELNNEVVQKENALKELKETQLQLINSEKMASLGQLIANVAHEINTPLASISANNEMIKMIASKIQDKNIEMIDEINGVDKEAIKRINHVVQSLKRFIRLDEMTQQEADINSELDLTLDLLAHKTKKGIEVIKEFSNINKIECYPNMLNQVFLNILMNAIQSVETKAKENTDFVPKIKIVTQNVDNRLVVRIMDNGLGIDKKNQEKIFQAGFTTKKVGEGTGLGLAICNKIIEKHNGEISFISNKKEEFNTEFIIKI